MKPLLITLLSATVLHAAESIDLSGIWKFAPDRTDAALSASSDQWRFPDTIQVPGQVAAQGFGEKPSMKNPWTGIRWKHPSLFEEWQAPDNFKMPFFLQPPLHYVAPAWYQKQIEIPADWVGKHALLHLERAHWQSIAWVNGKQIGKCNSLGTPHEYDLGALPPGKHVITLRIDRPLVQIIDDWVTNRKLGYIFEAKVGNGKLVACSFDLDSDPGNRHVARQMRASLFTYLSSDRFAPVLTMETADLEALVKTTR